jgi:hypothetical protein
MNMALLGLVILRLILSNWHHVATAERLYGSSDNLSGAEVPTTANNICPSLCFYEIFAQHYAEVPEDGKAILPLFLQLWSQSFASQIFALLFYRWLFEIPREDSEGFLRYSTAFVEGLICRAMYAAFFHCSIIHLNRF